MPCRSMVMSYPINAAAWAKQGFSKQPVFGKHDMIRFVWITCHPEERSFATKDLLWPRGDPSAKKRLRMTWFECINQQQYTGDELSFNLLFYIPPGTITSQT